MPGHRRYRGPAILPHPLGRTHLVGCRTRSGAPASQVLRSCMGCRPHSGCRTSWVAAPAWAAAPAWVPHPLGCRTNLWQVLRSCAPRGLPAKALGRTFPWACRQWLFQVLRSCCHSFGRGGLHGPSQVLWSCRPSYVHGGELAHRKCAIPNVVARARLLIVVARACNVHI